MVKVSVVIPVYNASRYIEQCLGSLLAQSLHEIEIICVDDGSTDNSVAIIDDYSKKDSRVKLLRQQNSHAGVARNNGMKHANGEYIIFLDADDFFEPDMLEKMYLKSIEDNADVCLCGAKKYNEKTGEFIHAENYFETKYIPENVPFSAKEFSRNLYTITTPATWTKLFKKSFVDENGIQFMPLRKSNDLYFTYTNLALAKRITYVAKDFVNYRIENEGSLQGQRKFTYDFFEAFKALKKELVELGLFKTFEQSFANRAIGTCYYEFFRINDKEELFSVIERYKEDVFYQLAILGHSRGYFYPRKYYNWAVDIFTKTPDEMWQIRLDAEKEESGAKNPLININSWVSPIKLEDGEIKTSVIIPFYNTEDYIEECVNSVINQTLSDIEIICVNDGSTDKSPEIVKALAEKDSRIKIVTKENGGLSSARNAGLAVARGEYILFLDSDDYIELKALEYLYAEAKNESLDQLYFTASSFCDDGGEADYNYDRSADYSGVMTGRKMFEIMSENAEFRPSACLQLIKRSFLEENDISFINGIYYEDNPFTMECLFKAKRVRYDAVSLYNRRLRSGSIMTGSAGLSSSYRYFITINHIKDVALRCGFAADKAFYKDFLAQIDRMIVSSVNYANEADDEEFERFLYSLGDREALDYYYFISVGKKYRKRAIEASRTAANARDKSLMDNAYQKCRIADIEGRMQAEIDRKSAQVNALKQQVNTLKLQVSELKEQSIKGKIKKFINK